MRRGFNFSFTGLIDGTLLTDYTGSGQLKPNNYEPNLPVTAELTITKGSKRGSYTATMGAETTANVPPGLYAFAVSFLRTSPSTDTDDVIFGGQGYILVQATAEE
jgi:hypothetical protein